MNRIVIIGRLTRDPELRTTSTGKSYAMFSVAVNKRIKPQNEGEPTADFFNVKVWGQTADYVGNYLTKGRLVSVDGRMESRKYTDQQGIQREAWEINADSVSGLDRPRDDASQSGSNSPKAAQPTAQSGEEWDPFSDEE